MKTIDQKIADLIRRHALLKYSNYKSYSRLAQEACDRIEREYIELTGYIIYDNEEHKKLLKQYNEKLKEDGLVR